MLKFISFILKAVVTVALCFLCLLAFTSGHSAEDKLGMLSVLAFMAGFVLLLALLCTRFHNWKRETAWVLLCAAGLATFFIVLDISFPGSEANKKGIEMLNNTIFTERTTGAITTLTMAILGFLLLGINFRKSQKSTDTAAVDYAALLENQEPK